MRMLVIVTLLFYALTYAEVGLSPRLQDNNLADINSSNWTVTSVNHEH